MTRTRDWCCYAAIYATAGDKWLLGVSGDWMRRTAPKSDWTSYSSVLDQVYCMSNEYREKGDRRCRKSRNTRYLFREYAVGDRR
ncbi:unnamed protein product [Periconia digitata]|uniref:Uncharacterized protein n=1 Tax=Periconia digitata TaxID=1303443 RepID=A0A9W4UHA7_9PLEO|nr:unnamed protein product [Periconia digitata]